MRKFYKGERGAKLHEKHPDKVKYKFFETSDEQGELTPIDLYYSDVDIDESPDVEMLIEVSALPPDGSEVRNVLSTTTPYIKIGILGDGYTSAEKEKFFTDAAYIVNGMMNNVVLNPYKQYFNVKGAFVPSLQSGAKHPNTAGDCQYANPLVPVSNPTNRYGATFDYGGTHRLLYCPNSSQITADKTALISDCPLVMIIVNTSYYGGSGGTYGICSVHSSAIDLMLHEFIGHSFTKLGDEYGGGLTTVSEKPNVTKETTRELIKWNDLILPTTPVPTGANTYCSTIGLYKGAGGSNNYGYRPACVCKMRTLGSAFCQVCARAIVNKIKSYITVQPPVVVINPSAATITQGQSVTLTASGATSYVWNTGATTASITVTPSSTTTYSVTGTKDGLNDSESVVVTVNPVQSGCDVNGSFTYDAATNSIKWKVYKTTCGLKYTFQHNTDTGWTTPYTVDFTGTTATQKTGTSSGGTWLKPGNTYTYRLTCVSNGCYKDYNVIVP